jgi:hypothetical protein
MRYIKRAILMGLIYALLGFMGQNIVIGAMK